MDLAVGTKFTLDNKTYIVSDKYQSCDYCDLNPSKCLAARYRYIIGHCALTSRKDRKDIVFKLIKDMNNIAEILKNMPANTKLYSPIFGEVTFVKVYTGTYTTSIFVKDAMDRKLSFETDGKYSPNGEIMLFPSKEMRDWTKLLWKRGDVLVSKDHNVEITFKGWCDDTYSTFKGKHYLNSEDENNLQYKKRLICNTEDFSLEEKDAAQCYINTIEERLGEKINMETFEVEHIKPKWTPKPFDKVIVRVEDSATWVASLFSHMKGNRFVTINCYEGFDYCLPYNEETAKLIGTTDNWEE